MMRKTLLLAAFFLVGGPAVCRAATIEGNVASVRADGRAFLFTSRTESGHFDELKILLDSRTAFEAGVRPLKQGMWLAVDTGPHHGDETPGTWLAVSLRVIPPLDGNPSLAAPSK
jgi:hypothetical protein